MAVGGVEVLDLGFQAVEAITKFRFVKLNTTVGRGVEMADTLGERITGVAQHAVSAGDAAEEAAVNVRLMGISTVECGATVTAGVEVSSDATARAINAATTQRAVGIAVEGGTVGQLITVILAGPAGQRVLP